MNKQKLNKLNAGRGIHSPALFFFQLTAGLLLFSAFLLLPCNAVAEESKEKADALLRDASELLNDGETDKALTTVNEAIAIYPKYPEAYDQLGFVLLKKGQLDDAINAFNSALELNPRFHSSKTGIGLALLKKGDTSGAEAILKDALTFNPYPSMAHYALGLVYEKMNDFENSTSQFKQGILKYKSGKR